MISNVKIQQLIYEVVDEINVKPIYTASLIARLKDAVLAFKNTVHYF